MIFASAVKLALLLMNNSIRIYAQGLKKNAGVVFTWEIW